MIQDFHETAPCFRWNQVNSHEFGVTWLVPACEKWEYNQNILFSTIFLWHVSILCTWFAHDPPTSNFSIHSMKTKSTTHVLINRRIQFKKKTLQQLKHAILVFWNWISSIRHLRTAIYDSKRTFLEFPIPWYFSRLVVSQVISMFFIDLHNDGTCWRWVGNRTRMKLAWKKRKYIKARIRYVVSFFVFSRQI